MGRAAAAVRRHLAFARRAGSRDRVAARCARAALLVLRALEELDVERPTPARKAALADSRAAVARLLEGLPASLGEVQHLEDLLVVAAGREREPLGLVGYRYELGLGLSIYALNRRDHERFDEALEVLDTARRALARSHEGFAAALERAELFVLLGRLDRAAAVYRGLADRPSRDERRQVRLAVADLARARGRYTDATRRFAAVRRDAQRTGDRVVELDADLGLGRVLLAEGRPAAAVPQLWRVVGPGGRWEAYVDLALALEAVGAWDAALRLAAHAALSPPPTVRWRGLAATLRLTARGGDLATFDRWRDVAERWHRRGQPSPSYEVDAWLNAARGVALLSGSAAARRTLARARAVARRAVLPGVGARVREAVAALRAGRPFPATTHATRAPEVRWVMHAVERFAAGREMVDMASGEFGKGDD